jgi:hypothetical protein
MYHGELKGGFTLEGNLLKKEANLQNFILTFYRHDYWGDLFVVHVQMKNKLEFSFHE